MIFSSYHRYKLYIPGKNWERLVFLHFLMQINECCSCCYRVTEQDLSSVQPLVRSRFDRSHMNIK